MKANEFIKKYGLAEAKRVLHDARGCVGVKLWGRYEFSTDDLKRLIKSHELVESYGGIDAANKTICDAFHGSNYHIPEGHEKLSLAIQDVESCQ